jgi:hypothetical protein
MRELFIQLGVLGTILAGLSVYGCAGSNKTQQEPRQALMADEQSERPFILQDLPLVTKLQEPGHVMIVEDSLPPKVPYSLKSAFKLEEPKPLK